jgi:hypothetical protein
MRRRWCALALVALVASPAACSDDEPKEGEARLEVDGEALVERADGQRETVDGSTTLGSGDRVTLQRGTGVMQLRGGTHFELREAVGNAADTSVVMGKRPVLEAGDLLVSTEESTPLEADGTDVEVSEGSARLTRAFGMSVAAYDAEVALDSAGVSAEVPALREMVVPDLGRPPRSPNPVSYDDRDPWDRRYLGAAIDLGETLQQLADDLTGLLPEGEGRTPGFFRLVLPGLEDEADFGRDDIDLDRDPGETLIGAAITDLGERGSFDERWGDVFDFRDDGAAWGIVALDQAVRSGPLEGSVESAYDAFFQTTLDGEVASSDGGSSDGRSDGGGTTDRSEGGSDGGGTDDAGSTDGATAGGGNPPSSPTTTTPTTPVEPPQVPPSAPPEAPGVLDPIVEPVEDLVDDLVGGLFG